MPTTSPTILLVHGGFVDGSGWEGVYRALKANGLKALVVQNPTESLDGDVAATRAMIDSVDGPVILVGHSYGGVVVTEAGNHANVVGLVYVAAFAPDVGESVAALIANPAPGTPVPPIRPANPGFVLLDREKFAASFAADLDEEQAAFMADSQIPWGIPAMEGKARAASWKEKPSWYLVATDDRMIPPAAQRLMAERAGATTVELPGSHSIYVSQAVGVAKLISEAANGIGR